MASVLIGFIFLAVGIWLYVQVAPGWAQAQNVSDPGLYEQVARIKNLYYGSLISMVGGGLLVLIGLVRQATSRGRKQ